MKKFFSRFLVIVGCLLLGISTLLATGCDCGGNGDDGLNTFENLFLEDQTVAYDGNNHSLAVSGLDNYPDVTVEYFYAGVLSENNVGVSAIGEYNVKATVSADGYKPKDLIATLTISSPSQQFTGLSLESDEVKHDGSNHYLVVEGLENYPNATVKYYYNDVLSENNVGVSAKGTHAVKAVVSLEGYVTKTLTATLKISDIKAEFIGLTISDEEIHYDGENHLLTINGLENYPGAKVTWKFNNTTANDGVGEIGEYKVVATVSLDGYVSKQLNATLTITAALNPNEGKKILYLNDYENHKDLDTMAVYYYLGKAELNDDETYIQSGEHSAKITVDSDTYRYDGGKPGIFQNCNLEAKGEDYSNFNFTNAMSIQVYNAQDYDTTLRMQLVYSKYGFSNVEIMVTNTLKANAWTYIKYDISRESIPINTDGSSYVKGIYFYFDRNKEVDTYYYIDSLTLYKTSIAFSLDDKTLASDLPASDGTLIDEICFFDKEWQIKQIATDSGADNYDISMTKEFTADGTGSALRVDTLQQSNSSWPSVTLSTVLMNGVQWNKYLNDDEFVFDVYIPGDGWEFFSVSMMAGYRFYSNNFRIEHGEWQQIRIKLGDIKEYLDSTLSFQWGKLTDRIQISFSMGRGNQGASKTMFIDNVRMVINR